MRMPSKQAEIRSLLEKNADEGMMYFRKEGGELPGNIYRTIAKCLLLMACVASLFYVYFEFTAENPAFVIDTGKNVFLKDGQVFRFISGSLHYFRIPRIYWLDRLYKAKAAGLDAVEMYIPWNYHETSPSEYNFNGDRDVVEFITLAHHLGLYVIVRAGPYICAEWDFGGLPAWLLSDNPHMNIRSSDPEFLEPTIQWFSQLLPKLKPLLYQNGGPIIMIQLENEYGSYVTCDHDYLSALYEYARFVLGDEIILYTTDGNDMSLLRCGSSDRRFFSTVDFGVGGAENPSSSFESLREFQPKGPLVNSEYYSGWLDHWGEKRHTVDATALVDGAARMWNMSISVSFNIYMFHGGTNFGLWNGANSPNSFTTTSYDYDAPISEAGDTTQKYLTLRELFFKLKNREPPEVPVNISKADYGNVSMNFYSHMIYDLPEGVRAVKPLHMEALKQYQGFMAYSTDLTAQSGTRVNLTLSNVRDTGFVFTADTRSHSLIYHGSMSGNVEMTVTIDKNHPILTIVAECRGHINYGFQMFGDIKGIIGPVFLNGQELLHWSMRGLDFTDLNPATSEEAVAAPEVGLVFKGILNVSFPPLDTFAVMNSFKRGILAINGQIVGRYDPTRGPQVSLYIPASMLLAGDNVVTILELEGVDEACRKNSSHCYVSFRESPVWLS